MDGFRPKKVAKLAKMTERAYLAEVASRQSFRRRGFAQPRPKTDMTLLSSCPVRQNFFGKRFQINCDTNNGTSKIKNA